MATNPNSRISFWCRNRAHERCASINCACGCGHRHQEESEDHDLLSAATVLAESVTLEDPKIAQAEQNVLSSIRRMAKAGAELAAVRAEAQANKASASVTSIFDKAQAFRKAEQEANSAINALSSLIQEQEEL